MRGFHLCAVAIGLFMLPIASDALAQHVELGAVRIVPRPHPGMPIYSYCPDGHIPLLHDGDEFQMYWAGSTSYRTRGSSVFMMGEAQPVLEPGSKGSFENGGAWLNAVFRAEGQKLIGFYHAEDHQFEGDPASRYVAWKSVACCSSADNGLTWQKDGRIITSSRPKPALPDWGGSGDFCVVRDEVHHRWLCFYQEHYLCVASSDHPTGKPGTWRKLYQGSFSEPGLAGRSTPLEGVEAHAGGNPSVHYNTYLKKWVMVWGTWDKSSPHPNSIWLSSSGDLLHWEPPQVVVVAEGTERCWYPTILGTSDVSAGERALLCYAYFPDKSESRRRFIARTITFRQPTGEPR